MTKKPDSKLEQSRAEIEELLRRYQQWGLTILRERKAELEHSVAESGGMLPPTVHGQEADW
ncbi:MAG: hypothetical protein AB1791_00090 [Chloroflexota bacterium]